MSHRTPATAAARPLMLSAALIALLAAAGPPAARADIIAVPGGDFTNSSAFGTVSGLQVFGPASGTLGDGTWSYAQNGLDLGFIRLGAPTLTIGPGGATIAGVGSLLGLNNGGSFSQVLAAAYQPLTTYTLSATLTTLAPLGVDLLSNTGAGIGLTDAAGNLLASTASPTLATVSLLSGTTYRVALNYTTGSAPVGAIGIRLFDAPNGLLNANVLGAVTFSNVGLVATPQAGAVPEPASMALLGLGLIAPAAVEIRRRRRRPAA